MRNSQRSKILFLTVVWLSIPFLSIVQVVSYQATVNLLLHQVNQGYDLFLPQLVPVSNTLRAERTPFAALL